MEIIVLQNNLLQTPILNSVKSKRGSSASKNFFIPKPVASCTTLLPVAIKTNAADGPLCGFTTSFYLRAKQTQV